MPVKTNRVAGILNISSSTKPEIRISYTFSLVNRRTMARGEGRPNFSWITLKLCVRIFSWLEMVEIVWHSSRSDTRVTFPSRTLFRCVNFFSMDMLASRSMVWQTALGNLSTEGDTERINKFFEVCLSHL